MAKEEKKQIKDVNSEMNSIKRAINRVAKTQDGKVVFKYLAGICGFSTSSIVINETTKEINAMSTVYMEARKTVYYAFRNFIESEFLKQIEYAEKKEENNVN